MKNIKLIIDFPESEWDYIKNDDDAGLHLLTHAIANAKPLQTELEEIKAKIAERKVESKQLGRNDYEMGLSDGRTTEKMAIIQILDNHIKELKGE